MWLLPFLCRRCDKTDHGLVKTGLSGRMRKQPQKRRGRALLAAAALLGCCTAGGGNVTLVSVDQNGLPGTAHSGFINLGFRRAQVLDDGTVFFLTFAALEPGRDTNGVADFYRRAATAAEVVSLPNQALGNCSQACVDRLGTNVYLFRQFGNPTQYELRQGPLSNPVTVGIRSDVGAAARAADAAVAAYDTGTGAQRQIVLQDLGLPPPNEINLTAGYSGESFAPALAADGTKLVFASTAWDLVAGDTNQRQDVFLYDAAADTFTLISQRRDNIDTAAATEPAISGSGAVIAFASADSSLVQDDHNGVADVFTAVGGRIERASLTDAGLEADADSGAPRLDDSGRFLVFVSNASLCPGTGAGVQQVYLRDRESERTLCLSMNSGSAAADADCYAPEISANGRYVTFVSRATNLGSGTDGTVYQVFRVDRGPDYANHPPTVTGAYLSGPVETDIVFTPAVGDADADPVQVSLVSAPTTVNLETSFGAAVATGQAYGTDTFPWRAVVPAGSGVFGDSFQLQATDGKALSRAAEFRVQTLQPDYGFICRASVNADGSEAVAESYVLAHRGLGISGAGDIVVFTSGAGLTSGDDDGGFADVYLRNLVQADVQLISAGTGAARNAYLCTLSGDGRQVAYYTQDGRNLLLRSVETGAEIVLEQGLPVDPLRAPALSWTGARVVYEKAGAIRSYDTGPGLYEAVSVNTAGDPAAAACAAPALSADGRVAAFRSAADNLGPAEFAGVQTVYLRYLDHDRTVPASVTAAGEPLSNADKPALSASGRLVAFLAGGSGDVLYLKDMATGACREIVSGAANPALSADGRFVCYNQGGQLYRVDLSVPVPGAVLVSNTDGVPGTGTSYQGVLSAGGQFTAFASEADNLVAADANGVRDVFVSDFGPPANQAPAPTLTTVPDAVEDTPRTGIRLTFTDADADDVRTEIVTAPEHGSVTLLGPEPGESAATVTYEPAPDFVGSDRFAYRCADGAGWSPPQEVVVTVADVNDPPQLAAVADREVDEGEWLQITLQPADVDLANPGPAADTLTYTVTPADAGQVETNAGGEVVYKFKPAYDRVARAAPPLDLAVTVRVEDSHGAAAEQTFMVRIHDRNAVPELVVGGVLDMAPAAASATIDTGLLQVSDADDGPADLQVRMVAAPARGELQHGGTALAAGDLVSYADLPLLFVAPTGSGGVTRIVLQAVDVVGAASAETELVIRFGETGFEIDLAAGWNVFSMPYTPAETDPDQVFARPGRDGTWAVGPVWYFDCELQVFRPARQLRAGHAYALYCNDVPAGPVQVDVDPAVSVPTVLPLRSGWNFVGPVGFGPVSNAVVNAQQRRIPPARISECQGVTCNPSPDGILTRGIAYWLYTDTAQDIDATLVPAP